MVTHSSTYRTALRLYLNKQSWSIRQNKALSDRATTDIQSRTWDRRNRRCCPQPGLNSWKKQSFLLLLQLTGGCQPARQQEKNVFLLPLAQGYHSLCKLAHPPWMSPSCFIYFLSSEYSPPVNLPSSELQAKYIVAIINNAITLFAFYFQKGIWRMTRSVYFTFCVNLGSHGEWCVMKYLN